MDRLKESQSNTIDVLPGTLAIIDAMEYDYSHKSTILRRKTVNEMKEFDIVEINQEFQDRFPDLYYILSSFLVPPGQIHSTARKSQIIPQLIMIYALIMHARNNNNNLVQRLLGVCLYQNSCERQVRDYIIS